VAGRSRPRPFVATSPQELESAIRERCLNLLAMQPRTRAELERSLARAQAPADVVAAVLDRLTQVGLVDDTAYAQAYVRTGVGVRRRGTRSLRAELRGRGVAPEIIEVAAAEVDEQDEFATALGLASRRAAGLARLAPEVRRRRLAGLLLRRGFSGAVVNDVLAQVLAEVVDDADGQLIDLDEEQARAFSDT
jgi:regulatory protein